MNYGLIRTPAPIVFYTKLSQAIGLGHAIRVRTLALECIRRKRRAVVIVEDPDDLVSRLDWSGLDVRRTVEAKSWLDSIGHRRNILVTDLPGLTAETAYVAREAGFKLLIHLCVDGSDTYSADLFINASPGQLPINPIAGRVNLGPRFAVVRQEIKFARPLSSWTGGTPSTALVAMGGSDSFDVSTVAAIQLVDCGIAPTLLGGPAVPPDRMRQWGEEGFNVETSPTPSKLADLMLRSDMVVTRGGITSFEAMCLGRPVACMDVGPEAWFCRNLAAAGIAIPMGIITLNHSETFWANDVARVASAGFNAVDGHGADRIATAILGLDQS